jgi:hypothetical protein
MTSLFIENCLILADRVGNGIKSIQMAKLLPSNRKGIATGTPSPLQFPVFARRMQLPQYLATITQQPVKPTQIR